VQLASWPEYKIAYDDGDVFQGRLAGILDWRLAA
jgi:hypothetical protein